LESSISGPVAVDLGASGALEEPAGLRVAEGSISAHVSQMISAILRPPYQLVPLSLAFFDESLAFECIFAKEKIKSKKKTVGHDGGWQFRCSRPV